MTTPTRDLAKCVKVDGIADRMGAPGLLWRAQSRWFGDAGAGSGLWPLDMLSPCDSEPPWDERY